MELSAASIFSAADLTAAGLQHAVPPPGNDQQIVCRKRTEIAAGRTVRAKDLRGFDWVIDVVIDAEFAGDADNSFGAGRERVIRLVDDLDRAPGTTKPTAPSMCAIRCAGAAAAEPISVDPYIVKTCEQSRGRRRSSSARGNMPPIDVMVSTRTSIDGC